VEFEVANPSPHSDNTEDSPIRHSKRAFLELEAEVNNTDGRMLLIVEDKVPGPAGLTKSLTPRALAKRIRRLKDGRQAEQLFSQTSSTRAILEYRLVRNPAFSLSGGQVILISYHITSLMTTTVTVINIEVA
jgi:hypothetical protein